MPKITITHISDPGCPWAYSALPAISALQWRYREQLDWRTVTIGLAEDGAQYEDRGYTPAYMVAGIRFGHFGMPFSFTPRSRILGTGRACRTIVAARLEDPALAHLALRALHFAWFTTNLLLDEDEAIKAALAPESSLDGERLVARLEDADVEAAYQADRATARTAAGSAAALQGKTASTDGAERFTAPTLIFEHADLRFIAGGHQPLEAHDLVIANLNPELKREPEPDGPLPLLEYFPHGLTTREISTMLAEVNEEADDAAARELLVELADEGHAASVAYGDDALWLTPDAAAARGVLVSAA